MIRNAKGYHLLLIFCLLILQAAALGQTRVCPTSMSHYWKLDETSGTTFADSLGTLSASCTTSPTCPTAVTGRVAGAQQFGSGIKVDVSDDGSFDWGSSASFAIEMWIRRSASAVQVAASRIEGTSDWWLGVWSDNRLWFQLKNGTTTVDVKGSTVLSQDVWYHVVAMRDAGKDSAFIYLNGVREGAGKQPGTLSFSLSTNLNIGWFNTGTFYYWSGAIDEIALYDGALTGTEIASHYSRGLANKGYCTYTPDVTDIPDQSITAGQSFTTISLDNYVSDADNTDAEMVWTYSGNSQLSVSIVNRVATITDPGSGWTGSETITFRATDPDANWDEDAAVFTVTSGNQPPVLAAIGAKSVDEGGHLSFGVSATDPDATTPSLSAYLLAVGGLPANASFTDNLDGTGTFVFDPDYTQSAVYSIVFKASDGSLVDTEVVAISVNNVNRPPELVAIGAKSVDEGGHLSFGVSATDPDATTPILSAYLLSVGGLPANASFTDNLDGTGTFVFDPDYTQSALYSIVFKASDGSLVDTEVVAISVNNVNRPPELVAIGARAVDEGGHLSFGVSATDPDATTPSLSAYLLSVGGLPANASFTDNLDGTGTFVFDPDYTQAWTYSIVFKASDGLLVDTEVVAVTVNDVNRPPELAAIGAKAVDEGEHLSFGVSATDPDATTPSLSAYLLSVGGLPVNAGFTDNLDGTGTFVFDPDYTQSGVYSIVFKAFDGSLVDTEIVAITVNNVNLPPVVAGIPDQTIEMGQSFATITLDDYVADPDDTDEQMTWSYSGNSQLSVSIVDRVATITPPSPDWIGSENITFQATDPGLLSSSDAAIFTITEVNDPPEVSDIPDKSILQRNSFPTISLDDYVSDPDNTDAELTWTYSGNSQLQVGISGGHVATITTPGIDWTGSETITFRATDPGGLWDEDAATFTVIPTGPCPTGMVHYWKLDETSGQPYDDAYGTTDATCASCPVPTSGVISGAQLFTSGLAQKVTVADDGSFDWTATSSFSLELWMKKTTVGSSAEVAMSRYEGSVDWWLGVFTDKKVYFQLKNSQGSVDLESVDTVRVGEWYHLVVTRDAVTDTVSLYVNGSRVAKTYKHFTTGFASSKPVAIGWFDVSNFFYWNGAIDEVASYDRPLTAEEISEHYAHGLIGLGYCDHLRAPQIVSVPSYQAVGGLLYTYDVEAIGYPAPIYALTRHPAGMTIDSVTGVLQWVPASMGSFGVTVKATNLVGVDSQSYSINVSGLVPTIISTPPTLGTVDQLYSYDVDATGMPAASYWLYALPPYSIPAGMQCHLASGLITWTPTEAGYFEFYVQAFNTWGADTQMVGITVTPVPITFTSNPVTSATVNETYHYDVNATGAPVPRFRLHRPPSPTAMAIDSISGIITWLPALADTGGNDVEVVAYNQYDSAMQAFTLTVSPPPPPPCPEGMTHYWKLDETMGSPYVDYFGTNDATCTACPASVIGRVGTAQYFDGTRSVNVSDDGTFDWSGTSSFSIEFWMRKSTAAASTNEVILGRVEMPMNWWIGVSGDAMEPNRIRFRMQNGAACDLYSLSAVTDNQWHLVVATREGTTGLTSLFVDGNFQNSVTQSFPSGFSSSASINMGWFNTAGFFRYTGSVDEVALYDRVLTSTEINTHYTNGLTGIGYCTYICGDANSDRSVDISDVVYLISFIFSGGSAPRPLTSGDANCDEAVDISDAVYIIGYIFSGGSQPCASCK